MGDFASSPHILHLRPYRPGDADAFVPRDDFAADRRATGWDWDKGPPPGRTWTVVRGREVVGIGGGYAHADGRWEAWALLSELRRCDWPRAVQLAGGALRYLEGAMHVRCIEAWARCANPGARRLLERLGFAGAEVRTVAGVACHHMTREASSIGLDGRAARSRPEEAR